jgi:hypothetical protein
MKPHKLILFALILACFVFAHGCSSWGAFRRGLYVAGAGAGGAVVGGPVGAAGAAGVVAVATDQADENEELRSGKLKGEEAYLKEIETLRRALANRPVIPVETPVPFVPRWVWWIVWGGVAYLVFTKGHWITRAFARRDLRLLFNIFLPSWAQKAK